MTRSAFTVFSALVVPCDKAAGGCGAAIGKRCTAKSSLEMAHCHTSRRKAADAQRTREVNPEVMKREVGKDFDSYCTECQAVTCVHVIEALNDLDPPSYLPMREPLPRRAPDLNADDEYRSNAVASVKAISFFPEGAKLAIMMACLEATNRRPTSLRVEWNAEHAAVIAHVAGINEASLDDIMGHAIASFPVGVGVDIRIEKHGPLCGCDDCEEERNR